MTSQQPVVPEIVARQLAIIRQEGRCNMLDRPCVQVRANQLEFYELVCYTVDNPKEYTSIVFLGAVVEETGQQLREVEPR
jgi:hypothetical protein